MKYMIISDIHGNIEALNKVLNIYRSEICEKLLILGDLINYGIDYNIEVIINRLNLMKENIVYVKGNCDENLKGIEFGHNYIENICLNNKKIVLTHGHLFNKDYLSKIDADIILSGHTHINNIENYNNKFFINPGSISKSRSGENSFAIIDNNIVTIRNLDNEILYSKNLEKN